MVARAETADGADTLGKRPDNKVNLVLKANFIGKAAAMGAQHAEGVGLIGEELEAVLLLYFDEIRQWRPVAQHGIDAFDDDKPPALFPFRTAEPLVKVSRIVVAET